MAVPSLFGLFGSVCAAAAGGWHDPIGQATGLWPGTCMSALLVTANACVCRSRARTQ